MHSPATVIAQLRVDLESANQATAAADATIHDAITRLVSGYGNQNIKHTGTITVTSNTTSIAHNCNSSKYLFFLKAESVPTQADDIYRAETVIGLYDANGISFGASVYNTVSAGTRYKNGVEAKTIWCGNSSTNDKFDYYGNTLPQGIACRWELYDLSNC